MQNKLVMVAVVALSGASAFAGYKTNPPVQTAPTAAFGPMGTARNSADNTQYMGCELYATAAYSQVVCSARDAAGTTYVCYTQSEEMKKAVTAMTDNAHIVFNFAASDPSQCTSITVKSSSRYAPPVL